MSAYDDARRIASALDASHRLARPDERRPAGAVPPAHAPLAAADLLRLYAIDGAAPTGVDSLASLQAQAARDERAHDTRRGRGRARSLLDELGQIRADTLEGFVHELWRVASRDGRLVVVGVCLLVLGLATMVNAPPDA